jgi:hypothetical protein
LAENSSTKSLGQGTLTEREGSVPLTSLIVQGTEAGLLKKAQQKALAKEH